MLGVSHVDAAQGQPASLIRQRAVAAEPSQLCLSALHARLDSIAVADICTCLYHTSMYCCRWVDAGKFLTGFSAIGSVAVPAILFHAQVQSPDMSCRAHKLLRFDYSLLGSLLSHLDITAGRQLSYCQCSHILHLLQKITAGALWTELAAVAVLGATVFAFDFFSSSDSGYYTY